MVKKTPDNRLVRPGSEQSETDHVDLDVKNIFSFSFVNYHWVFIKQIITGQAIFKILTLCERSKLKVSNKIKT